jgi:hypothetical protein
MADATLTDVVKKLEEVKFAVKAGDKVTAGAAAKAEEAGAEKSREDAAMKKIFEEIRDKLGMKSGGTGGAKSDADGGGTGILDVFGGLYFVKQAQAAMLGLQTMMGTSFFGKGGLFRNLKASFLKSSKKLFGKTGLKLLLTTLKIGSRLAGLFGVILMPIIDGIFGYFNAEKFGVSKVSGVLGGVLAGGEGGIMNMFMNAGKWAAIGATIGSVVPVVGTIAGGLIGAVIGGILGLIGGDVVAKSFDKVGVWFVGIFDTVVDAISKVWHAVMPKWFTEIDFAWTDIFPTGLVKLFKGEYFTVDVPEFSWYSLFPNFLVEWFKGTAEKLSEKPFSWTDLLPKAIVDFFTGAIAKPDYEFSWKDLVPTFIVDIIEAGTSAFKETPFTWYSLLPDFLVNLVKGVKIKEGSFEWTDLLPGWITKIIGAGKEAGETDEGGFDWRLLLPDWMGAAWGSAKKAAGEIKEGTFNWRNLLPTWLHGAFDSTKAIGKAAVEGIEKSTGIDMGSMFDIGAMMAPIREKITSILDPEKAVWGMGKFTGFLKDTLLQLLPKPMATGGLVGMSPFAKGSMGRALGLESGGMFTLSQGEMVLDNQAAAVFLKAAQMLTGSQALEQSRMGGGGQPVIINNNNVDNSVKSNSRQNISAPESVRQNESTLRALMAA